MQHNSHYVTYSDAQASVFLYDQVHFLHLFEVLGAGCDDINARSVDARMPQNICQLGNILFHTVKRAREQMPQIVREHLAWQHSCLLTQ